MSYATKLQYAGGKPFEPEDERLPYPIFEALSQDEQYTKLAQVRWLADELESDVAGNSEIPEETRAHIFRAVADRDAPLQVMVDAYVQGWIAERQETLVEDWGIEEEFVDDAIEEYDGVLEEVTA